MRKQLGLLLFALMVAVGLSGFAAAAPSNGGQNPGQIGTNNGGPNHGQIGNNNGWQNHGKNWNNNRHGYKNKWNKCHNWHHHHCYPYWYHHHKHHHHHHHHHCCR